MLLNFAFVAPGRTVLHGDFPKALKFTGFRRGAFFYTFMKKRISSTASPTRLCFDLFIQTRALRCTRTVSFQCERNQVCTLNPKRFGSTVSPARLFSVASSRHWRSVARGPNLHFDFYQRDCHRLNAVILEEFLSRTGLFLALAFFLFFFLLFFGHGEGLRVR